MMGRMNELPTELNWVSRRVECSSTQIFRELQKGIEDDVATVNKTSDSEFGTTLTSDGRTFVVSEKRATGARVVFFISGKKIEIRNEVSGVNLVAVPALNTVGRCVLTVDGVELEQWQLRKMALEGLFFSEMDD
jgi:hypothetical protein